MNNPTERDQQIARAAALELHRRGFLIQSGILNKTLDGVTDLFLAAIQDANQQGNEDTARMDWLSLDHDAGNALRQYLPWHDSLRSAIDAARGVQPAAKEPTASQTYEDGEQWLSEEAERQRHQFDEPCDGCGKPITDSDSTTQDGKRHWECRVQPAAKEETVSEQAAEIRRRTGCKGSIMSEGAGLFNGDLTPAAQQESAPAAEQGETHGQAFDRLRAESWRYVKEADVFTRDGNFVLLLLDGTTIPAAPSPSQDKPGAASDFKEWWGTVWTHPDYKTLSSAAAERIWKAALSASSPSEQKSSLPAETLSAQEQERQETSEA